jgi:hypothetical protein
MDQAGLTIPPYESLDPNQIEVFLDVDTDELTIMFHGRDREHYVHPMNDVLSYLLDIETDEVVGVIFSRFMRQVIHEHPEMRDDISMATVLIGGITGQLWEIGAPPRTFWQRARRAIRAGRQAWESGGTKREPLRALIEGLPSQT